MQRGRRYVVKTAAGCITTSHKAERIAAWQHAAAAVGWEIAMTAIALNVDDTRVTRLFVAHVCGATKTRLKTGQMQPQHNA